MTLLGLAARNIKRHKVRVIMTAMGAAIAVLAFMCLRTVVTSWEAAGDAAAKDRIATRHKVTFIMSLPKKYIDDIRGLKEVKAATWANWFGGKHPTRESEFFATIAVDVPSFLTVYDEIELSKQAADDWRADRTGAVVGDVLAKTFGWKVGDKVKLRGTIFPGNWDFTIRGIYTAKRRSVDRNTFWFHWKYLNESLPEWQRDKIGWIVTRIDNPRKSAEISRKIDKMFDDRDEQTVTMSEKALQQSFMGMFGAILTAIDIVSVVILMIMMLILGNTIAMGVRERTHEYGVMRAIGFMPYHIVLVVLGEAITVGILGGLLGLVLAYLLVNGAMGPMIEMQMGAIFPYFRIAGSTAMLATFLAVLLSVFAAIVPAYRAARLDVVSALRKVG